MCHVALHFLACCLAGFTACTPARAVPLASSWLARTCVPPPSHQPRCTCFCLPASPWLLPLRASPASLGPSHPAQNSSKLHTSFTAAVKRTRLKSSERKQVQTKPCAGQLEACRRLKQRGGLWPSFARTKGSEPGVPFRPGMDDEWNAQRVCVASSVADRQTFSPNKQASKCQGLRVTRWLLHGLGGPSDSKLAVRRQ